MRALITLHGAALETPGLALPGLALPGLALPGIADPDDPGAFLKDGQLLVQLRRLKEARESFRAALALDPDPEKARRALCVVERLLDDR